MLADADAQARGQLPHLPLQVGLQVVVVQEHDVEVGGLASWNVCRRSTVRRSDDATCVDGDLVVGPLPEAVPLAAGARPRRPQRPGPVPSIAAAQFALAQERADVEAADMAVYRQRYVTRVAPDARCT